MPIEVILPRVDMDMATGKISKWYVTEGATVAKGAPIFEIETDKAAMEVESPGSGVIRNISASEGVDIPVGTPVAFIYGEGETAQTLAPAPVKLAPAAQSIQAAPVAPVIDTTPMPQSGLPRATPLARRLARERGLKLPEIAGSGPRGRIQAEDVKNFRAVPPPPQAELRPAAPEVTSLYQSGSYDIEPISGMRRIIAERLVQSKQTVPHFYLSLTCDLGELLHIREKLNDSAPRNSDKQPAWKLSINDFVIKALALALQRVPNANVTWTDAGILKHRASDVGVAVAVEGGLFTPVIRAAETKSLSVISLEMKELAARARARRLTPSEYQGGTTAVSNLGMYGIEEFAAIINPPHATILAVGAGIERPAKYEGRIELRTQMTCTLSCDHRAVDGALGAELLAAFRTFIEEPALMLA
ncbi:dihydrolipoamide acetyltransferase family protein [Aestuariivirga sp. YIM B02566]|uniref:2-oxo acid dehydrogenase subunit E2 n=1 Tax=Taklimakanibacter albus TaxID=2800327 RepID=A0ACC5RD32_9HYPH|nr:dihydrolipoamide acetyltransferase family protein [Aestuariivirga sp. YIM B02566]MBK1870510.1 2-oxo acid dehydrogenase subunit E2 [Aestuariivirga sp. YIM B02566]